MPHGPPSYPGPPGFTPKQPPPLAGPDADSWVTRLISEEFQKVHFISVVWIGSIDCVGNESQLASLCGLKELAGVQCYANGTLGDCDLF